MPRRRELADVADGMTGHVLGSVGATGFPFETRLGPVYVIDLLTGTAAPTSRRLTRFARTQLGDFSRHLSARSIPVAWATAATLTVEFGEPTMRDESLLTCRVEVIDDTGRSHTSTRRGGVWHPVRRGRSGLLGWLRAE